MPIKPVEVMFGKIIPLRDRRLHPGHV